MYPYIYSSIIYHCQNMETTWMSINRWMDKEDMGGNIYIYIIYSKMEHYLTKSMLLNKKYITQ